MEAPSSPVSDSEIPGATQLHEAAWRGSIRELERLVRKEGMDVNLTTKPDGWTSLHVAVDAYLFHQDETLVESLIHLKADPSRGNRKNTTPLMIAALQPESNSLEVLIRAGADLDARNANGRTAMHKAVHKNNVSAVTQLCNAGADLNIPDNRGITSLMLAARHERADTLQVLIRSGASLNAQDHNGDTAVHMAIHNNNVYALEQLCKAGADVEIPGHNGCLPTYVAVFRGYLDILKVLEKFGADLNQPCTNNCTLLIVAVELMQHNVLDYLARHYPGLLDMKTDDDACTALHVAVKDENEEAVHKLCEARANVNAQDSKGYTPLMFAVSQENFSIVFILHHYDADPTITSSEGTALEIAKRNNCHDIFQCIHTLELLWCKPGDASRTMKALSDEMMCSICLEVIRDPATAHPCQHSFCAGCLQNAMKENKTCPNCRADVQQLVTNHMLANVARAFGGAPPAKRARW